MSIDSFLSSVNPHDFDSDGHGPAGYDEILYKAILEVAQSLKDGKIGSLLILTLPVKDIDDAKSVVAWMAISDSQLLMLMGLTDLAKAQLVEDSSANLSSFGDDGDV